MADDIAIKVEDVSKVFHEHAGARSFKEAFVNTGKKLLRKKEEKVKKGDFIALSNISFEVKKGEFFGIVGRNGCGKSTLLKILAGVYTPASGGVQVNGKLTPFIELGVGFNPELSGRDNVFLNGALLGFTRKQMENMYDDIVDFAELKDFMDTKLKNYSSGMQVRLAFSVAIRAESDILLIDEVLAVGDAAFQQKCFDYFDKLKNENKTVILVTHDMSSVRKYCNKAIYIEKGKLVKKDNADTIADLYTEKNVLSTGEKISHHKIVVSDSDKARITAELLDQGDGMYKIICDINSSLNDLYVGASLIRDNIAIAEFTSEKEVDINQKCRISYNLNSNILVAGQYYLTFALFRKGSQEWVASYDKQIKFVVKNYDHSRAGYVRLPQGWATYK